MGDWRSKAQGNCRRPRKTSPVARGIRGRLVCSCKQASRSDWVFLDAHSRTRASHLGVSAQTALRSRCVFDLGHVRNLSFFGLAIADPALLPGNGSRVACRADARDTCLSHRARALQRCVRRGRFKQRELKGPLHPIGRCRGRDDKRSE